MSLTPDATRSCASCSTPLNPGSTACARCGHIDDVHLTSQAGLGVQTPVRPQEPVRPAPAFPPQMPMVEWPQNPAGPAALAMPPAGPAPLPPALDPGLPPVAYGYPGTTVRVVAAKTPGIAVVLSIWLGVGHLYVGENGLGFGLLAYYLFLCLLSLVPILWILTIPIWFVSFILVAINASKAAHNFNRRNGLVIH